MNSYVLLFKAIDIGYKVIRLRYKEMRKLDTNKWNFGYKVLGLLVIPFIRAKLNNLGAQLGH